jgi:hypothetical protein
MPGCDTLGQMKKKHYRVWIDRTGPSFIEVDSTSRAGAERAAVEKWKRTEGRPVIVGCQEILCMGDFKTGSNVELYGG